MDHPPRFMKSLVFGAIDKVAALLGATEPLHWLTIGSTSSPIRLYEIDGKTYTIDIHPPKGLSRHAPALRPGTLATGRIDMDVTVTEVTDPAVKHQVVIAWAAQKPSIEIATGEHKHLKNQSTLVTLGYATDDTPEGLATAVPHVSVFEITPGLHPGQSN
jgi:hypothetical protein